MELEIQRMNEEIIELREDNQRLHKMCSIVQQINDILSKTINECKCASSQTLETKSKNKLSALKDKYQQLKATETHFSSTKVDQPNVSDLGGRPLFKRLTLNESVDQFETTDQMLTSNDKQNQLLTIETIDSFYRPTEELNIEFVLPKVESNNKNQKFIQSKRIKRVENKNKVLRKTSKKLNKTNEDSISRKRSKKITERTKRVACVWPGCQLKFRDSYNMSVHMLRHTGQKSFACCNPGCHKTYTTKAALDVHHNSHLDNRRFKCPYSECSAAFIRKTQLNVHISQSHTRDFPYKCNWPGCEYQGNYLNRLNSHRLSHTGVKPFKCEWKGCGASFRLNHHLKAHMLKHTGERPILCQLSSCDKRFQSKQAMKIHFERTHQPFKEYSKSCKTPKTKLDFQSEQSNHDFEVIYV